MRKIGPEFTFDEKEVNASLIRLSSEITSQTQDSADTRKRLGKAGFSIETAEPKPPDEAGFIAADSSFSKKELRFNVLWGVHAVCV